MFALPVMTCAVQWIWELAGRSGRPSSAPEAGARQIDLVQANCVRVEVDGWLVGRLVGWLVGLFGWVCWLVGWLVGWMMDG